MVRALPRQRSAVQLRRNRRPHDAIPGKALGRNSKGASSRPSHFSILSGTPGAAQGSDMLGVTIPPFAKEVSRPTPA